MAAAIAAPSSPATSISRDKIHPSPTNPRKTFDQAKLQALATSIGEHGIVQPLKVRPHPTRKGEFELVLGERRWRAAEIAGLEFVPAVVEDIDATRALEQQLVENTQREDVHPLEEAAGYRALLDNHGHTMDTLIAKTGRSKAHLYGRLKLLELVPAAQKALRDGKLGAMHAELIARLDPKVQPEALKDALGGGEDYYENDVEPERLPDGEKSRADSIQPLSFRALQQLIHRKYTLALSTAPFPLYDEQLNKAAGPCTTCQFRSGQQPDLFPDLKKPADSCTKPVCFESKVKAHWEQRAESAKSLGHKVITGKDAKGIVDYNGKPTYNSEYISLDQELPYDLARPGSKATWGKLLGKAEATVPKVLVQDERGAAVLLVDKKAATKILREAGKLDEAKKPTSSGTDDAAYRKELAKEKEKASLRKEAFKRVLLEVGKGAQEVTYGTDNKKAVQVARWLALQVLKVEENNYDAIEAAAPIFGEVAEDSHASDVIEEAIQKAKTVPQLFSIIAVMMFAEGEYAITGDRPDGKVFIGDADKVFDADWAKCMEAAKAAAKAEEKVEAAKEKAKAKPAAKKKGKK